MLLPTSLPQPSFCHFSFLILILLPGSFPVSIRTAVGFDGNLLILYTMHVQQFFRIDTTLSDNYRFLPTIGYTYYQL